MQTQAIKADITFLRDALPNLQTDILTIRDTQHLQWDGQQLQVVLDWVSPTDFPAQQHDIISRRQEGTGQWPVTHLFLGGADSEYPL